MNTSTKAVLIVLGIIVVSIVWAYSTQPNPADTINNSTNNSTNNSSQNTTTQTNQNTATLALTPSSVSTSVDQTFTVDIVLDTNGNNVDGVDVYSINYNPEFLAVVGQVKAGTSLNLSFNKVDATAGKIMLGAVTEGGKTYQGTTAIATITFKALKSGSANLSIDFTSGKSNDSNVASNGKDILGSVAGATVNIK